MSKKEELLSIKQVATIVGVSQQAVYKQLNNKLKDYVVEVEGTKKLRREALEEVYNKAVEQKLNNNDSTVEQPIQPEIKIVLETLQQQLKEKDEQIRNLQISLDKAQNSLDNAQKLHGMDVQRIMALEDKANNKWYKRLFARHPDKVTNENVDNYR